MSAIHGKIAKYIVCALFFVYQKNDTNTFPSMLLTLGLNEFALNNIFDGPQKFAEWQITFPKRKKQQQQLRLSESTNFVSPTDIRLVVNQHDSWLSEFCVGRYNNRRETVWKARLPKACVIKWWCGFFSDVKIAVGNREIMGINDIKPC